jgi:GT2 family glycosyltransferase
MTVHRKASIKSIEHQSMSDLPLVSVVIGSYNRKELLILCIEAIRAELKNIAHEIIVIDGGSSDGSIEWLSCQKDIILILQHNRGKWKDKEIKRKPWSYFMNLGFKSAQGKFICMLSDDSLIIPNCIRNGLSLAEESIASGSRVGAVAFYFRDYPIRKKYAVAINLGNLYVNHGLFLRQAVVDCGFCDESYHFYFADTDLALKIKQCGYQIIRSPGSFVEHYFEATPDLRLSNNNSRKEEDRLRLIEKWAGVAYPYKDKANYLKIVGYWEEHPKGFVDSNNTIKYLIKACDAEKSSQFEINKDRDLIFDETQTISPRLVHPCLNTIDSSKAQAINQIFDVISREDMIQVLYADLFWTLDKSSEEVTFACKNWMSRLYRIGFEQIKGNSFNTLFVRSLKRSDYKELFWDIINAFGENDKRVLEGDNLKGSASFRNYIDIFSESKNVVHGSFNRVSATAKKYLVVKLVYYIAVVMELREAEFRNIVFFADMQPLEHMLSLYFGRIGIKTVTLQHGLYVDYGKLETVNKINYLHHPSQHFLSWGDNTSSLIKKYHPTAATSICGKPRIHGLRAKSQNLSSHIIVVILDQKPFYDQNIEMCSVVSNVAQAKGFVVKARLHPSLDRATFFEKFNNFESTHEFDDASLVVGHTSSLLYEAMTIGYNVARFASEVPALALAKNLEFKDKTELLRIIEEPSLPVCPASEFIAFTGEESKERYRAFYEANLANK